MEVLVGCHDGHGNMVLERALCVGLMSGTSKEENESEVGVPEGREYRFYETAAGEQREVSSPLGGKRQWDTQESKPCSSTGMSLTEEAVNVFELRTRLHL